MNFYDILAAKNWGGGIASINFFDLLFAQSISGGQWQTYEGTLPATINANGADMRQYQIYGNTGGVGDKTENLLNYREIDYTHVWNSFGQLMPHTPETGLLCASSMIAVIAGKTYIRAYNLSPIGNVFYAYDAQKNFISRETPGFGVPFTIAEGVAYIAYNIEVSGNYKASAYMLTEGSTPPASYMPYGYKLDMSVSDGTNTTITPIYIGDTALQKDEYVDYQAQKVYRVINGTLTPTDPPVTLPALPTAEGETIVDYAGESVAQPEKVLLEYAKGGN